MAVTVQDVARHAGVSAMTVSRVANGAPHVAPATRAKVERAIQELGYVPNGLARGLTSRRTGALGLIVPDVANPFFTMILRGAETVARQANYRVTVCSSESDPSLEDDFLGDMVSNRVEGVIIAAVGNQSRNRLKTLAQHKIPFILVDRAVPGLDCDLVHGDSRGGARELVGHLVGLGHRRIAMIAESPDVSTARDRHAGYCDALLAVGVEPQPELLVKSSVDPEGGHRAMRKLLDLPQRPSAVFAVNYPVAVGAVRAIREAGLDVPSDIAVVCFDDIEYASVLYPFLTVMVQPAETFGTMAAQLLLERISGRARERRRLVVLPADLIVRQSCGAGLAGTPSRGEVAARRSTTRGLR